MPPSDIKDAVDRLEEAGFTRHQAMTILHVLHRMMLEATEEEQAAAPPPWAGPTITLSSLQSELGATTSALSREFARYRSWFSRLMLAWIVTNTVTLGAAVAVLYWLLVPSPSLGAAVSLLILPALPGLVVVMSGLLVSRIV